MCQGAWFEAGDKLDVAQQFQERLNQVAKDTEVVLDRLLAAEPVSDELARPARLLDAMRYAGLGEIGRASCRERVFGYV